VFPIHPTTVAKFREAFKFSGAKSDPLDTNQILEILKKWPTFQAFQQAKPSTIKRFFYGHNVRSAELIENVVKIAEKSQALTTDRALLESGARLSQMNAEVIETLNPVIEDYEKKIEKLFQDHPDAKLFSNIPGAGPAMAPRLLAAFDWATASIYSMRCIPKLSWPAE
jgi:hypothetical protein